jgi:hypothetical protein
MAMRQILVQATKEQIFKLLTDYERYAQWAPDVAEAVVLAREGDVAVAEFDTPYWMRGRYQLEFVHVEPCAIMYRQQGQYDISWGRRLGLHGSWRLSEPPQGAGVLVTAEMTVTAAPWRALTYRRLADLVLQRRLSVLQHLFQPASADLSHGLSKPQQQLLQDLAIASGQPCDAGFSLWFHGAP